MRRIFTFILCIIMLTTLFNYSSAEQFEREPNEQSYERCPAKLLRADNFSEGLAWVSFTDYVSGSSMVGLLTASGEVIKSDALSSLNSQNSFGSPFSAGYAYYNYNDDVSNKAKGYYIFDAAGEIASASPDDGTFYEVLAGGDGLFLVRQDIRSMTENETRMGIVRADGTWLVELSALMPFMTLHEMQQQYPRKLFYYYLGEGIFAAIYRAAFEDTLLLYNANTHETGRFVDDKIVLTNELGTPFRFYNGLDCMLSSSYVYSIDTNCNINAVKQLPERYEPSYIPYYNGIFLLGTKAEYGCCTTCVTGGVFYNLYGETVLDFSQYELSVGEGAIGFNEFRDGCAAVKIHGVDHELYLSHIRSDGSFVYEPIKIASNISGCYGNGNALGTAVYFWSSDNYSYQTVTQDGTVSTLPKSVYIDTTKVEISMGFYGGIALYSYGTDFFYIDQYGIKLYPYVWEPVVTEEVPPPQGTYIAYYEGYKLTLTISGNTFELSTTGQREKGRFTMRGREMHIYYDGGSTTFTYDPEKNIILTPSDILFYTR